MTRSEAPDGANRCGTCFWFGQGRCHRFPPQVVAVTWDDDGVVSLFPEVCAIDGCGEWKEQS